MACKYCLDCTVDDDLTPQNDFSAFSVGDFEDKKRLMLCVGGGRSLSLDYEEFDSDYGEWLLRGFYRPKYCPECGRKLIVEEQEE